MPIFEYQCKGCGKEFEALVLPTTGAPACPACKSTELDKLISRPAIKSETTHGLAMKAARKRDKIAGSLKAREQREYELHHND
ncbi:MAG: FmdB family zinc ribbon protein [Acidimicrobiia bacterium]